MSPLTLSAPPKVNLFLHITGQRDDGYHNLQTLFQLLDGGDQLTFNTTNNAELSLWPQIEGVAEQDNLIIRAARALQQQTGCTQGCSIELHKRLPMGAGLGGGSSNAATTLLALNNLWDCNLSIAELAKLGACLGADVPVFIEGRSAFAEGIGDQLTPIDIAESWYLVITPPCKVSTAEIFSHPQLTRNSSPIKIRALPSGQCRNDCQKVVMNEYPEVRDVLDWAANFAEPLLTGTGSSVFCKFDNQEEARRVLIEVPKKWKGFVAKGINRSSVQQQVKDYFNGASPSG